MNILITAIGSMSADAVINSIRQNFPEYNLIGTDTHPKEWLYLSDKVDFFYKVSMATSKEYIDRVYQICKNHNIDFILPLTDPEVDVLSKNRKKLKRYSSSLTLVDDEVISVCRNKKKFADSLANNKAINTIKTYTISQLLDVALEFPVIAKPRKGRSSEGVKYIYFKDELESLDDHFIVQNFIDGEIVAVDFVRDYDGHIVSLPRKELIRSSNGAGLSVKVFQDKNIEFLVAEIAKELGIIGCMNIEFIYSNGEYYLMDINPRFSAGVGFSKILGYDFILNHIRLFKGLNILPIGKVEESIVTKHYSEYISGKNT